MEAVAPADLAVVERRRAGDRGEERGLAGAVPADEADPLARLEREGRTIEERQVAVSERSGEDGQKRHRRILCAGRNPTGRGSSCSRPLTAKSRSTLQTEASHFLTMVFPPSHSSSLPWIVAHP